MLAIVLAAIYTALGGLSGAFLYRSLRREVREPEAVAAGIVLGAVWPITAIYVALAYFASLVALDTPPDTN